MKLARIAALAAASLMGTPGLARAASAEVIWAGLCDAAHPGARIPIPLRRDGDDAPAKPCHAACGVLGERRLPSRR